MKKIIIAFVIFLILTITGFIIWSNRTVSKITLDINPSIEINLKKGNKVKSVVALNDDAKELINEDFKGKELDKVVDTIANKITESDYAKEKYMVILLHSEGNVDNKNIEVIIRNNFDEKNIGLDIVVIENITKEDKKLAKKYNISPTKAAYINSVLEEQENVPIDSIVNKSITELGETKNTGKYCPSDYKLEGDFCIKAIGTTDATPGDVCKNGYYEYEGKCYLETPFEETDKLVCNNEFKLVDNNCVKTETINANPEYKCDKGELMRKGDVNPIGSADNDKMYCIDKSTGKAPTLRCLIGNHIIINGKCYVGPAPTINGGCPNNDTLVNGGCYSLDPGDQWQCPNGAIYEKSKDTYIDLCPDTFTYINPTITGYTCPEEKYTLKDKKCIFEEIEPAEKERICPTGYTKVDYDRCIDKNKIEPKISGYICDGKDVRVEGNKCVTYKIIDANY